MSGSAPAGERAHLPVFSDAADAVVVGVGDVDFAFGADGDADGRVEARPRGRAVEEAGRAFAREGRDDAFLRDLPNTVVARVGDVEVAVGVEREAGRGVEGGGGARAVREALAPAREREEFALRRELADAVAGARVREVDRAVGGGGDAEGLAEASLPRGAVERSGRAVARDDRDARPPAGRGRPRLKGARGAEEEKEPARGERREQDEGDEPVGPSQAQEATNLRRYSMDWMKALTSSAWTKLPLNFSRLPSQKS